MDKVLAKDIESFVSNYNLTDKIENAKFLITGATGLIGSTLIRCLMALDKNIYIYAPVRNLQKAKTMFQEVYQKIDFIECDIVKYDYDCLGNVDYIVHCAAPTASKFFVDYPVETFDTIYSATKVLLDYAKKHNIKSFVYLSSLEVYGTITDDTKPITENIQGYIDPLNVRSSYPMAKRAVENLCVCYSKEYGIPVKIARLTQTTGAGISRNDNRIIAQFARLTANCQDIVLHTTGESARPYCYTIDCISALLYILLKGKNGEAYNVANEETYISARGMAEYLKSNFNDNISVRLELSDDFGYAPSTKLRLSSEKLRELGWTPKYGLKEIFANLIEYLIEK